MIPIVAAEEAFIREVLIKNAETPAHYLRFALLPEDFSNLVSTDMGASSTYAQVLTGLIQARVITAIKRDDMVKGINANLVSVNPDYVELALMCSRHFVHFSELTTHDESEFVRFGVTTHHGNNIKYDKIQNSFKTNVVKSWNLVDGGVEKISSHALDNLSYIGSVKIYDRFFNSQSLDVLVQLFSAYSALFGKFPGGLSIYVGRGLLGLTVANIASALSSHIDLSKLLVSRCEKVDPTKLHIHDRFMQFDNDYTFEFTAGLACYVENNGSNRSSTVYLRSIVSDYTEFEVKDQSNSVVKFRY